MRTGGERLKAAMETAGAACHELNQPLQSALMLAELTILHLDEASACRGDLARLKEQLTRMAEITHRLNHLTGYVAKPYVEGSAILDLEASSRPRNK